MSVAWLITMGTKLANARKLIYPIPKQDNVQIIFKSKVFVNSFKKYRIIQNWQIHRRILSNGTKVIRIFISEKLFHVLRKCEK